MAQAGISVYQRVNAFIKHWSKEIVIASILAIVAAFLADPILDWHKERSNDEIIENNKKAVAVITVYDKKHELISQGSGFFVSNDGKLATNYHVISESGISEIRAQLSETKATYFFKNLIGKDENKDFALLQFDAKDTPFVQLGDSGIVKAGQKVIAIGAPLGHEDTVSEGIISNAERKVGVRKYIQFTAPISPGSSGGALIDKKGDVVGITAASFVGTPEERGQNLNLAVPINLVRDQLSEKHIELPADKATNFYLMGQLETNKRNYDKALEFFKEAIRLDETNADAFIGAANVFYEKNEYDSEVKYLEIAVSLNPKNHIALYTLGTAYEDVGKYSDAIKMYKAALKIKSDDKDSMFYLSLLSVLNGDVKTARDILPDLMKLDPGIGREIEALIKLKSR